MTERMIAKKEMQQLEFYVLFELHNVTLKFLGNVGGCLTRSSIRANSKLSPFREAVDLVSTFNILSQSLISFVNLEKLNC